MILVKNKLRQPRCFNLEHKNYCAQGKCACQEIDLGRAVLNGKDGTVVKSQEKKKVCSSLRFGPLEKKEIDERALNCLELKAAVQMRTLQVLRPAATPASKPVSSGSSSRSSKSKASKKNSEPVGDAAPE